MFKLLTKKIKVPQCNETREVEVIQSWAVTWYSRYGEWYENLRKETEFFFSEEEANAFAESLRKAFKLLRHTSCNIVKVEKK